LIKQLFFSLNDEVKLNTHKVENNYMIMWGGSGGI